MGNDCFQRQVELYEWKRYLLDAESNTQSTGTLLYLHKNTVHYRLNKIRSVLKCDLAQMPATLAVYKAAVVYRILKGI